MKFIIIYITSLYTYLPFDPESDGGLLRAGGL